MFQALHYSTIHCMNVLLPLRAMSAVPLNTVAPLKLHFSAAINAYNDSKKRFLLFYYSYNEV